MPAPTPKRRSSGVQADAATLLPATSMAVCEFTGWLSRQPVRLTELLRIIRQEPALAANVFRAAAEEDAGPPDSLQCCIVLLGITKLRALAFVIPVLSRQTGESSLIEPLLWRARKTARLAERIAGMCGSNELEYAYLAGLLQEIGLLAQLWRASRVSCRQDDGNRWTSTALARAWHFPPAVVSAMEHHQNPQAARQLPLAGMLGLAASVCAASAQNAGSSRTALLECFELVQKYLPGLRPAAQTALAQMLVHEYTHYDPILPSLPRAAAALTL
jgi:HD-like signal output (HDOD) protein